MVIIFRVDLSVLFNIFTNHSKAIRICTSICHCIALIALGLSTCSTSEVSKTYKKYNKLVKAKKNLAPDPKFNWWALYFFTFFCVAVEFGFNYQMLDLTVDFASEDILLGLEFWGRVISGVGLSLVFYRLSSGMNIFNSLRYVLCLIVGIALMWNVQKMLTDYTDAQLTNAYRNLIIPPLTLGISIFLLY